VEPVVKERTVKLEDAGEMEEMRPGIAMVKMDKMVHLAESELLSRGFMVENPLTGPS
jgi:hypothetical protein